jgi:hypothetical protein
MISGLLLGVVTSYYEQRATEHAFSETVVDLKFERDETNGLQER